jgi:hypothetical protein
MIEKRSEAVKRYEQDRASAAAYIAVFLPELSRLSRHAGHEVLAYLIDLAEAEAKQLCGEGKTNMAARSRRA